MSKKTSRRYNQQVLLHIMPSIVRALAACNISLTGIITKVPFLKIGTALLTQTIPTDIWLDLANKITKSSWDNRTPRHFPIELAKVFSFDHLIGFNTFALSSSNIKEATQLLEWLPPFICPSVCIETIELTEHIEFRLTYTSPPSDAESTWAMTECIMATMYTFWKPITFHESAPLRLNLRHPAHPWSDGFQLFMDCPTAHEQDVDALLISKEAYLKPILTANTTLHEAAQRKILKHILPQILKDDHQTSLSKMVELSDEALSSPVVIKLLELYEREPELLGMGIDACSQHLGMSMRTLQRKLADAQASHRKIQFEVRRVLAKKMLRTDSLGLDQIANMLGYGSTKEFTAAFKQAENISPRLWRARENVRLLGK
jgi:AraC-like DNA-binding protein